MGDDSGAEKKNRIQIDLNASTSAATKCLISPPVVGDARKSYDPYLYTFRVKTKGKTTQLRHVTAKVPPFYLLFDHALAVIWTLFSKSSNKKSLGIVQLQWALYFLQSIFNSDGIHPKDVQLCIDTIQDYLIGEYADMSEESIVYGTGKFEGPGSSAQPEEVSFSVNYSQMMSKCPAGVYSDEGGNELFDTDLLQELENVKHIVGIESVDLSKVASKEQVMEVLNDMQKEQFEKISKEVKLLYVVEDMMKNTDTDNFRGYTDERQFEGLFKKNA